MKGKYSLMVNGILATILLTSLFFITFTSSVGTYDPWADINDDGYVNAKDAIRLGVAFDTSGTPLTKASIEYDSGWMDITNKCGQYFNITHSLNSTEVFVDVTGKTTLDTGPHQKYFGTTGHMSGWSETYGGAGSDVVHSLIQASDGGYALAGYTSSFGSGGDDCWLIKVDSFGNVQWNRTYGGTGDDGAYSVAQMSNGGFVLAGWTYSFGAGDSDLWLIKTDSNGNMEWNQTYGTVYEEAGTCVIQTLDGGYGIAGWACPTPSHWDFWLVKVGADGEMQWNKTYGEPYPLWELASSIVETFDGGYLLAGDRFLAPAGPDDFWLVKTDSLGNTEWNKTYGGMEIDCAWSVIRTVDGGYAVVGVTYSFGIGESDFWLIKINVNGNLLWNQTYGGTARDEPHSVIQTRDGGYAIAGFTESFGAGGFDFWIVKTDTLGNTQWSQTYGGIASESGWSVVQTSDGGYALAGYTSSFGPGGYSSAWLIKTGDEFGLAWTDSTADTITLYRGAQDADWNYVRVRIWKIKETP